MQCANCTIVFLKILISNHTSLCQTALTCNTYYFCEVNYFNWYLDYKKNKGIKTLKSTIDCKYLRNENECDF